MRRARSGPSVMNAVKYAQAVAPASRARRADSGRVDAAGGDDLERRAEAGAQRAHVGERRGQEGGTREPARALGEARLLDPPRVAVVHDADARVERRGHDGAQVLLVEVGRDLHDDRPPRSLPRTAPKRRRSSEGFCDHS